MSPVVNHQRTCAITRSKPFEHKELATHALNVGSLCGHGCKYCSTPALERHKVDKYRAVGHTSMSAFANGYAFVDPTTPQRIAASAKGLKASDTVMFCSTTDAWSPEAQQYGLGRDCVVELLKHWKGKIRILTKNAAIVDDFDIMIPHADRIELSLSITGPRRNANLVNILEPNASPLQDRWDALKAAKDAGIKVYGMLCPCMPGIVDGVDDLHSMMEEMETLNPTSIWTEPVNARGPGLILSGDALRAAGHESEADKIHQIRRKANYAKYEMQFIKNVDFVANMLGCAHKLKILSYADNAVYRLTTPTVIWLKK